MHPPPSALNPAQDTPGRYRWVVVALLWWACFFNYADRQAIYSVFPLLRRDLHLNDIQLGLIGTAFIWAYALTGPIAGWLCDRARRKLIILGALLFWSSVTAATAFVHQYPLLVVVRALSGLGEAFYFPAALSMIGDYHPASTRSRAMSLHQTSVYVGTVAGGGLAALVAERHGWHQSFLVFGLGGVLLVLILALFLREPHHAASVEEAPRSNFGRKWIAYLNNGPAITLTAVFVGANFVASTLLTWLPTYLFQHMGLSITSAGLQSTLSLQGASICGVMLGGWLADYFVLRFRGGRMLTQALGLLCGFPFLLMTGLTHSLAVLLTMLIAVGLAKGIYDSNIWASLYDVIAPDSRGFAVGLMNSIGWIGGGLAPIYVALASRYVGMGPAISSTAFLYLVLGTTLLLLVRHLQRSAA
jgi:predicted MFS family arabinose efflux permease